jgi:hypothetical protein
MMKKVAFNRVLSELGFLGCRDDKISPFPPNKQSCKFANPENPDSDSFLHS